MKSVNASPFCWKSTSVAASMMTTFTVPHVIHEGELLSFRRIVNFRSSAANVSKEGDSISSTSSLILLRSGPIPVFVQIDKRFGRIARPSCNRQIILRVSERRRLSTSWTRLRPPMKGNRSLPSFSAARVCLILISGVTPWAAVELQFGENFQCASPGRHRRKRDRARACDTR